MLRYGPRHTAKTYNEQIFKSSYDIAAARFGKQLEEGFYVHRLDLGALG